MRSALILLCTLLIVGAGFALYTWTQPSRPGRVLAPPFNANAPTTAPAASPANPSMPVSSGEGVYVESYDPKKGFLTRRFRAAKYEPQPDGTVKVTRPEAEFYTENGQMMRLRGDRGEIVVPPSGAGTEAMSHPPMPTRGRIEDVTLMLFPPGARWPTITCKVPNVTFDNDTFIIQTDAFKDAKGKLIAADEVPVSMRGDDYDFDGRGLTIHWDERNRRLQRMEVAHGHSLILKHPKGLGTATTQPATPPSTTAPMQTAPMQASRAKPTTRRSRARSNVAASIEPSTQASTGPSTEPTTKPGRIEEPYRAEFHDNVRIVQADKQIAECETMNVDFLMNAHGDASQSTTSSPAKSSASAPSNTTAPRTPASRPLAAHPVASAHNSVSTPATAPATQPEDEAPVIILWTGKLVISAAPDDSAHPQGKDAIVEMIGVARPVIAQRDGSEVRCANLRLHTEDDSLFLRGSDEFPQITMKDANGTSVVSRSFEYNGENHVALVRGKSHAEFPITDESAGATTQPATRPVQVARVDWTQSCTLHMTANPENQREMSIERAVIKGEVSIDHPQMKLNSRELDLAFDPTAPREANRSAAQVPAAQVPAADATKNTSLKHMLATGDVHGRFVDADNPQNPAQTIQSQTLNVDFERGSDGRSYPKLAVADGDVKTGDGKSQLSAEHLKIGLAPSTQPVNQSVNQAGNQPATQPHDARTDMPRLQMQSLFAQQNVRAVSSDGKDIRCDQLDMKQTDSGPLYTLQGTLSEPAQAGDGTNTLVGPIIEFEPDAQRAKVTGAGSMHAVQQPQKPANANPANGSHANTKPPSTQPIDVTWQQGLVANGKDDLIKITGNVTAKSRMDDGTTNVAQGNQMIIVLAPATQPAAQVAPAPATQPATQPAIQPGKLPSTHPSKSGAMNLGGGEMNAFRDKVVQTVTIDSTPQISEVQSTLLAADGSLLRRLHLFATQMRYEAADKKMVVPVPGRMLYEDQTKEPAPATRPAPRDRAAAPGSAPPVKLGTHGATAFEWKKDFTYDEAAHQAIMTGNVDVVHKGSTANDSYRLNAQRVIADLESTDSNRPAADEQGSTRLKKLTAEGEIMFTSANLQFLASSIEYDPVQQILIARGTDRQPATLLDKNGLSQTTFTELRYDTNTGNLQVNNQSSVIRRTGQ